LMAARNARFGTSRSTATLAAIGVILLMLFFMSAAAHAQNSPATSKADANSARQQQERQVTQPLNNQPVWGEARSGAPQTTTVRGRETNVLIQPEGQMWRAMRNSMVSVYAGWALVISGLIITFGKNILLPLIGYTLFSWLTIFAKNLHNFLGPLFIICLVLI